jgi:hypothetical protein
MVPFDEVTEPGGTLVAVTPVAPEGFGVAVGSSLSSNRQRHPEAGKAIKLMIRAQRSDQRQDLNMLAPF